MPDPAAVRRSCAESSRARRQGCGSWRPATGCRTSGRSRTPETARTAESNKARNPARRVAEPIRWRRVTRPGSRMHWFPHSSGGARRRGHADGVVVAVGRRGGRGSVPLDPAGGASSADGPDDGLGTVVGSDADGAARGVRDGRGTGGVHARGRGADGRIADHGTRRRHDGHRHAWRAGDGRGGGRWPRACTPTCTARGSSTGAARSHPWVAATTASEPRMATIPGIGHHRDLRSLRIPSSPALRTGFRRHQG